MTPQSKSEADTGRSDELIARKPQQTRDPIARPLEQPVDPSRKRRDDMTSPKACIIGAGLRVTTLAASRLRALAAPRLRTLAASRLRAVGGSRICGAVEVRFGHLRPPSPAVAPDTKTERFSRAPSGLRRCRPDRRSFGRSSTPVVATGCQ